MIRPKRNICKWNFKFVIFIIPVVFFLYCCWCYYQTENKKKSKMAKLPIFRLNYSNYRVETYVNPNLKSDSQFHNIYSRICDSDQEKTNLICIDFKSQTPTDLQTLFHKFVANPHGGRCPRLQRFGGIYQKCCQYWDGHKFLCFSELMQDIKSNACLIYSFGVSGDWSFEKAMDDLGCRVLMFDPTVNYPKQLGKNISFEKIGVSAQSDDDKSFDTLSSILKNHGHTNTKITYLKIDIEGHEVDGLLEWLESGALTNVQQLGLEFHLLNTETTLKFFHGLAKIYVESDFRLISFDLNGCAGKVGDKYVEYAEIVLMRPSGGSICIEKISAT